MKYCTNCGKELKVNARFCSKCGQKVEIEKAEDSLFANVKEEIPIHESSQDKSVVNDPKREKTVVLVMCAIILTIIVGKTLYNNTHSNRFDKLIETGQKYLNELDYERAVASFTKALKIDPNSEDVKNNLENVYYLWSSELVEEGQEEKALTILGEAYEVLGYRSKLYQLEEKIHNDQKSKLTDTASTNYSTGSEIGSSAKTNNSYSNSANNSNSTNLDINNTVDYNSSSSEPVNVPIDWSTYKYSFTDRDGYQLEETLEISPYIDSSNNDALESAWRELGGNVEDIPRLDYLVKLLSQWKSWEIDEAVYLVGTIQIKNNTNGFDISPDKTHVVRLFINIQHDDVTYDKNSFKYDLPPNAFTFDNSSLGYEYTKMFYAEPITIIGDGNSYGVDYYQSASDYELYWGNAVLNSNNSSKIKFIMVFPNKKTPDMPNGINTYDNMRFVFGDNVFIPARYGR